MNARGSLIKSDALFATCFQRSGAAHRAGYGVPERSDGSRPCIQSCARAKDPRGGSFIGISKRHTTNLAVVAPGIAEALLATAFGLAAAIPAVVTYNMFARSIAHYRALYADASVEILTLVGRDLSQRSAVRRQVGALREPDGEDECPAFGRLSESRSCRT